MTTGVSSGSSTEMSNERSIAVVKELMEAWNAKDWDRWAQLHDENVHHDGPDHAQTVIGREAMLAAHTGLGRAFPDFQFEITRIFAQGDLVCAEWSLTGTQNGPFPAPGGRSEPTGKTIKIPGCFVFRIAQDKVAEYVGHPDLLNTYIQLGILPPVSMDVGRH